MKNVKNHMKECFGVDSNNAERTKILTKEVISTITPLAKNVIKYYSVNGGAEGVKKAFSMLQSSGSKFIFFFPTADGFDGAFLAVFDNAPLLPVERNGVLREPDEIPSTVYINPPSQTMNEHISRIRKGELIIHIQEDGKILHSVFIELPKD